MSVVAYELRARIRCLLGLWVAAGEDVRAALRGLEEGGGGMEDDDCSDDEREAVRLPGRTQYATFQFECFTPI